MQPLRRRLGRALLPAAAIAILAVATPPAQAQLTAAQQSALRAHCRSDFMSHCFGTTPGSKEALICLQKNVAGLSPACQQAVRATMPPPKAAKAPPPAAKPKPKPAPTAKAAPKPAPAPKPAAAAAPPPKKAVKRAPPRRAAAPPPSPPPAPAPVVAQPTPKQLKALRFTCRRDFRVHCRGVPPGGVAAFACLARHQARLTQNCRTSVRDIERTAPPPPPAAAAAPPPAQPAPRPTVVSAAVMVRACKRDMFRHCRGVDLGGGRMLGCLVAHARSLTIRCRTALKVAGPLR